ncbi:MAG: 5-methyltetrahydrofolate--homocysteine methyltransferase [Candidatus Krumholzibacteriia bacterium]|jgi:5-methyltetrahydrofolate--homocysteine methyltransferase
MLRLTRNELNRLARERILILDGAMGTMIQTFELDEAAFRGDLLKDHDHDLKGNNDILCLTQPDVITDIYRSYLAAGADIITTNTFNGTSVAQSDYGTSHLVTDLNVAAAKLARDACDDFTRQNPDRPRFVAGSLAPTNRTCSISPDVNSPGHRNITFNELVISYGEEAEALLDGGADILIVETIFDPLNAKAAVFAVNEIMRQRGIEEMPLWISGTITDASGRTLTGQTAEAFWISLRHSNPTVFGLNCALGATALRPYVEEISRVADTLISAHPNAGLPNELGGYDESPDQMAAILQEFAESGLLNIVGGCCGTTPEYVEAFAKAVEGVAPRQVPEKRKGTFLAGLEPLRIDKDSLFVNIGERTNVAGSKRFARLIRENKTEAALEVGRQQVRGGAQIVDVNMDDAMLESVEAMSEFLNVLASDPEVSRVPVMIDSSRWEVLEAGLQRIQGKGVVNSISLKDGEDEFRRRARLVMRYGAAAVVMAFDEDGQADSYERRVAICQRAWRVLVDEEGFPPEDVIFDPNVFAVATGLSEHNAYAVDFIKTCRAIKETMPGALISGGISNLSFSFRGNDTVREAMHSVFLYYAIQAGLDMGIVNAGQLAVYQEIEPELLKAVEDVIQNNDPEATDRLLDIAAGSKGKKIDRKEDLSWREGTVNERLSHALLTGEADYIEVDTEESYQAEGSPIKVIEGPLMAGLDEVGELFGAGKMFLPQVIRSARVMKKAVAVLDPYLEAEKDGEVIENGRVLMATVKGDVHDIGKNIVAVVLGCNNYDIIDLGVMVPVDRIIETAIAEKVDIIGLSGLITPSLSEMTHVAQELTRAGMKIPLLIGGATTSRLHTAVKIAPHYDHGVIYVADASKAVGVVGSLLNPDTRDKVVSDTKAEYEQVRIDRESADTQRNLMSLAEARANATPLDWGTYVPPKPAELGTQVLVDVDLNILREYIDWTPFLQTWQLPGSYPKVLNDPKVGPEAKRLLDDGNDMLDELIAGSELKASGVCGLFPAARSGDDLVIYTDESRAKELKRVPFLRQQRRSKGKRPNQSLVDYIAAEDSGTPDYVGAFVVTAGLGAQVAAAARAADDDDYKSIMIKAVADRLAEAFAEYMHLRVRREYWGYAADEQLENVALIKETYQGIRPAPGYPACPDHFSKEAIFELLDATELGVSLTESCAINPAAAVAGWYFSHPEARYFGLGKINDEQVKDYAKRTGMSVDEAGRWLDSILV